ncbi:MAG: serine/threonine protein kinase [Deltaproteobacteria bacterium]|nr:serine/threonine protein kinase [Deltaproteobacteria bacterium]
MDEQDESDEPLRPAVIGRYRIDGELGRGAMGTVYLGHDTTIDRPVAIKTIHRQLLTGSHGAEWEQRFRREVRAAGRCVHPNIVTVFDYGEADGLPYIVMEHVDGSSLRELVRSRGALSPGNAAAIIEQVLLALGHAHEQGVVHRDVKPANVLLLADGQVKVTDFGIARLESVDGKGNERAAVGTPGYMAPEQFGSLDVDRRADLYSAGVVLFELLTGSRPFHGGGEQALREKVLHQPPPRPSTVRPSVPRELDPVLERALAKGPAHRFQSAEEFLEALLALGLVERELGPGPLDSRVGKAPVSPAPTFDEAVLGRAERALVEALGPIARVLVRRTAQRARSLSELAEALATAIPDERERRRFRERVAGAPVYDADEETRPDAATASTSQMPSALGPFDQATLEAARHHLAEFLGPIAKVLVKQAAGRSSSVRELYRRLADEIADAEERARFLARSPSP